MIGHPKWTAVVVALLVLQTTARAEPCLLPGQKPMLVTQLFFGLDVPHKGQLAERVWRRFLKDEVTPRFPDGFTVFDAYGQWQSPKTSVIGRERTKVVEIAAPQSPDLTMRLTDIVRAYESKFHQESVGVVTIPGCGAF